MHFLFLFKLLQLCPIMFLLIYFHYCSVDLINIIHLLFKYLVERLVLLKLSFLKDDISHFSVSL